MGPSTAQSRRRERRAPEKGSAHKATGRIAGILEDKICLAQGRTYVFNSSIAQFAEIRIQPAFLGDRCIAIADLYALWRPRSVKFKAISLGTSANVCVGHLYPDAVSAGVTTMEEFVDLPACAFGSGLFGSPQPSITLEKEYWQATSMTDWYTTSQIPNDNLLENAGVLIYGNENSTMTANNFRGVIEWEFEFKSMLDPQVSLSRLEERKYPEMFPALSAPAQIAKVEGKDVDTSLPSPAAKATSPPSAWTVLPQHRRYPR